MAQLRFKGFRTGSSVSLTATDGVSSENILIPGFQAPAGITALPRIANAAPYDGDVLTLETTGLTGITAYDWRSVGGGASLGASATLNSSGQMGQWITCVVTCDQGVLSTPPVMVYMAMAMESHNVDDAAIVALCAHAEATHIAIADGDWSDINTWLGGLVPSHGARVLIPHGRNVRYDFNAFARLDWVRVDGTLHWAKNQKTCMRVETLLGTRGSLITMGTGPGDRMMADAQAVLIFSARHYRDNSFTPTDLQLARDPLLWGRGFVSQGTVRMWGQKKKSWLRFAQELNVGDTSATLDADPSDWSIGDQLVISGTTIDLPVGEGAGLTTEDEIVTITGLSGATVTWAEPLVYAHKNLNPRTERNDLYPVAQLYRGRNITLRSEETADAARQGHFAMVHALSTTDLWDAQFLNMGRTDKRIPVGIKDANGDFETHDDNKQSTIKLFEPFTARSNIIGRYGIHLHHVGFEHSGARPVVNGCYVEGTPGWGIVHHACDADLVMCSVRDFEGAGIVAEQGSELGTWFDCIASGARAVNTDQDILNAVPKQHQANEGFMGDTARDGYGFFYRGRALKMTGNVAFGCAWGHVFYHRSTFNLPNVIIPILHPPRSRMDLKEIGQFNSVVNIPKSNFNVSDYPINHFTDNEAIACLGGFFVTKDAPGQRHDFNVIIKRFKSWGHRRSGATIEYVGTYIFEDFDCTGGRQGAGGGQAQYGVEFAANAYQLALRNSRTQGNQGFGVFMRGASAAGHSDGFDSSYEPRLMLVGHDSVDDGVDFLYDPEGFTKTQEEVVYIDSDWNDAAVDYTQDPSENAPLVIGTWTGQKFSSTITSIPDNTLGLKASNLPFETPFISKIWDDGPFPLAATGNAGPQRIVNYVTERGYHTYNGNPVAVQRDAISDPITGRPAKIVKLWNIEEPDANHPLAIQTYATNNGPITVEETPILRADIQQIVPPNGSAAVDVVSAATGGNGSIVLDEGDYVSTDNGILSLDYASGTVTYTPKKGFVGTDVGYVFLRCGGVGVETRTYKTVMLNFLVGSGTTPVAPAPGVNFGLADGGSGTSFILSPSLRPETGGRDIRITEYTTDGGASWRRLMNHWHRAPHVITTRSDGTPVVPGVLSVALRLKYDHEFAATPSGASSSVTVT